MASLTVRVQPGARRSGFVGWYGDQPKLAVTSPPVDGAANAEAQRVLADAFRLRPRQVRLITGSSSRTKRFELDGVDDTAVAEALARLIDPR